MKQVFSLSISALICFLLLPALPAAAETEQQSAEQAQNVVDREFVSQYATVPAKADVLIIDSRPSRKYDSGHIVPAINISDSQFDKLTNLLPEDKSTLMIFYCGGLECNLSQKSADKAEALGYTNVKVYAAGYPDWKKAGNIIGVSEAYVKKQIDTQSGAVIIDARPARKYKSGHVPGAINISNREFEDKLDLLPADKGTELIYYCGGYKCNLSAESAQQAVAKGYTNVKLFQAGYPAWKAAYGAADEPARAAAAASTAPAVETGDEEGIITIASFNNLIKGHADSYYWYDVRDPEEVEADGTYAKAVVMAVDEVEDRADELPSDRPIIFFCSTGARSGEAYDIVRMKRDDLKVYFLDANVEFYKDGSIPTASPPD